MRRQGILLLRSYVFLSIMLVPNWGIIYYLVRIVVCQTDVLKYMLQKLILSGRIGKWAYALIEYDLAFEFLKSMRGQIVADFSVEHRINDKHGLEVVSPP